MGLCSKALLFSIVIVISILSKSFYDIIFKVPSLPDLGEKNWSVNTTEDVTIREFRINVTDEVTK